MIQIIEAFALQKPRLPVATIHRKAMQIATEKGLHPPGYRTVYDLIQQMDPALLMLAHDGSKEYRETYDLLYRREAEAPNTMWQADHALLDILLKDDRGEPQKPWLTIVIDDYSRALAGYLLTFDAPCALHTALALRQAVWRKADSNWQVCGIPDVLYTDNGSDFISEHIEQVCADLKIRMTFLRPGQPRGRGRVERFFSTVNQRLLTQLPGYKPPGTSSAGIEAVLELKDLMREFERFVLQEYHHEPHSATGVSPHTRWSAEGFLPRLPESLER
ncbi:hypothetical protein C2W62_31710 [Candidatus Entotheonella serta]|nr:hypothetical protein C2W62_31710 [Candidatus Entotheonella serta]